MTNQIQFFSCGDTYCASYDSGDTTKYMIAYGLPNDNQFRTETFESFDQALERIRILKNKKSLL